MTEKVKVGRSIVCVGFLCVVILLGGCATGAAYSAASVQQGKAIVYVYRERHMNDAPGFIDKIFINGIEIGALVSKGYFVCHVSPGPVKVSREMKFTGLGLIGALLDKGQRNVPVLTFSAAPAQEYFVMWKNAPTLVGYTPKNNVVLLKAKTDAMPMITRCRLIGEVNVP